ncbi:hypothetical protein C8R48DRAFT_743416, partial [Suillus tomentosus]
MVGSCHTFSLLCVSSAHLWQCDTNATAAAIPAPGIIIADSACCFTTPSIAGSLRTSLLCVSPTHRWSLMQRMYNYLMNVSSSL